jgi:hypothetical protein
MPDSSSYPMRRRPCLTLLGDREVMKCVRVAFDALSPIEQASFHNAVRKLLEIRGIGENSILRLILVLMPEIAEMLDKLDATIIAQNTDSEKEAQQKS